MRQKYLEAILIFGQAAIASICLSVADFEAAAVLKWAGSHQKEPLLTS